MACWVDQSAWGCPSSARLIRAAVSAALAEAEKAELGTIAMPGMGTGVGEDILVTEIQTGDYYMG